jgi:hypothetical protein
MDTVADGRGETPLATAVVHSHEFIHRFGDAMMAPMNAEAPEARDRFSRSSGRLTAAILALAIAATISTGCSYGTIVNTDDTATPAPAAAPAAPPPSKPPSNEHLANAFDYAAQGVDGETGYYFTSPSKRWVCAIFPRKTAGCQSATGSGIVVKGAPTSVPGPQPSDNAPNAIEVDGAADAQFAALDPPGYALVPGPATVLPFGEVLAVADFRCNVQEASGIPCLSEKTGKGFTFSADAYTLQYTDLPD